MSSAPERIDRYEIHGELGAGGFGTVYRARHIVLGTDVALKVLSPQHSSAPGMVERFLREAQTAAGIGNPHIVGVSDAGVTKAGLPFLAMELLEGEDLEARIKRTGKLDAQLAVDIVLQLLIGLGAAHGAGIVHRDLKPGNVFLTPGPDGRDFVKLLDFGISKVTEPGKVAALTQTGMILGTPAYMAPEQFQDTSGVDHRADLYAVGVVLFEALTGKLPYESESFADLMARVQGRLPQRLDTVLRDAPPRLVSLIDRALSRDPAHRFQTASDMGRALTEIRSLLGATPAGFASYGVVKTALIPSTGMASPSPITPSPAMPYGTPSPVSGPGWGPHSAPPSAAQQYSGPMSSHASVAQPRSRTGLWLALGGLGIMLPLACIIAGALTFALSEESEPEPVQPSYIAPPDSPAPLPTPTPQPNVNPWPAPPDPTPLEPPPLAASDGPPVAVPIPEGASPCSVPVTLDVACDRAFDTFTPETCEATRGHEMIVVGAYAPMNEDTRVTVDVARTVAPIILVLSAYADTNWVIRTAEGVTVSEIHLAGRGHSRVVEGTPPGVRVQDGARYPIMGWSWEGMSQSWSGQATAEAAERHTRHSLRAYLGCYNPRRFHIGQSSP